MEPEPAHFVIDLNDPADLAAKRDEAVAIVGRMQAELRGIQELEHRIAQWQARADFLTSQLPETPAPSTDLAAHAASNGNGGESNRERQGRLLELVVEVVNRAIRPIKAKEVHTLLTRDGHDLVPGSVSNALHYAAHGAKKIKPAAGRGMYAPLEYQEAEQTSPNGHAPRDVPATLPAEWGATTAIVGGTYRVR
jgi:hypothetical protein